MLRHHWRVLHHLHGYLSPEQTGRMNRGVDYRTDFYALGVIFYELLTGSLPFQAEDTLELIHCHIAKFPLPPSVVAATIPEPLSQIVVKLLAKTAEERYQSALGLRADLEHCAQQWARQGAIAAFPLGQTYPWISFSISSIFLDPANDGPKGFMNPGPKGHSDSRRVVSVNS